MSLFFVDSSCDLDFQQIRKLGVESFDIPYSINDEEKSMSDDFDYSKFYSKVRKGIVLNSRQLTQEEYIKVFEPALIGGDDVIYVHSSAKIFDTSNLLSAKDELIKKHPERKFEIVDTKNFSIGCGAVAFLLALQFKNGYTIDELVQLSTSIINETVVYLVVDSTETLTIHGLVSNDMVVGSALNIKTIIAIDIDGNIKVVDKVSGKKRALSKLVHIARQTSKNIADYPIIIAGTNSDVDIKFLDEKLKEAFGKEINVMQQRISPRNLSIAGLGAVALTFHVHKKLN